MGVNATKRAKVGEDREEKPILRVRLYIVASWGAAVLRRYTVSADMSAGTQL